MASAVVEEDDGFDFGFADGFDFGFVIIMKKIEEDFWSYERETVL